MRPLKYKTFKANKFGKQIAQRGGAGGGGGKGGEGEGEKVSEHAAGFGGRWTP